MITKIPNYIKFIFSNAFFIFCYLLILRLVFYFFFSDLSKATPNEVSTAFGYGIRFDLKLTSLLLLPLAILIFIVNNRIFKNKTLNFISKTYLLLCYIFITLFYVFDFGYYDYLSTRLDAASLRFLSNLKISTQVLFESYPVYKGLFALLILIFLFYKLISWIYNSFKNYIYTPNKKQKAFFIIVPLLILALGVYNSFTHYPLRWSQAFFSQKNSVNQFALNPVLYFFDSFKFRNEGFDTEKTKKYYSTIARELNLSKTPLEFKREIHKNDSITNKPNIVIVMLESLGTIPMSHYGNPLNSTPHMDSIIRNSVSFPNFYVHKAGTAGSVFASVTGLPDVDGTRTASRNPFVINQRIIFNQFDGYEKLYFLGGSANWANIRGVFQANTKDLKVFEEGSYEVEKRSDVWGIDDYELFKESNKELKKLNDKKQPFVAYIQTATNHMPFTVPDQKESYKPLTTNDIDEGKLKEAGFDGIDRLNALRYLDFNVFKFLERAKKAGYYDNTIFLFFGDHNTSMSYVKNFDKDYEYRLNVHHVPFFIHSPKYLSPKEIKKYTKLADVFPTAASLANINYTNYTLGNDALKDDDSSSFAFLYQTIKGEPAVTILKDSLLYSKTLISGYSHLFNTNKTTKKDIQKSYPILTKKMDSLLNGYYHSTKYLYYNNKKD
ncbi:sulfatase [Tenacibaculum holothuriorum]|uniref:Sulfatase n=1 Tax=Tenacibaculum holothuriorum TaxID=1635173 RepID=A0A1Y2PAZ7_9FLAO|nr:LTA synthase family protein [Tenacibaculum holothuriorum]OSY87644.1 sulfatase [Tenacibaculum holothuriorum]